MITPLDKCHEFRNRQILERILSSKLIRLLVISVAAVVCICTAIVMGMRQLPTPLLGADCESHEEGVPLDSPSGTQVALIRHEVCASGFAAGSTSFDVLLSARNKEGNIGSQNDKVVVFSQASNKPPNLAWVTDKKLAIQIIEIAEISKSIREANGVDISYSISKSLYEENYLADQQRYKERSMAAIENGTATYIGGSKERNIEYLAQVLKRDIEQYEAFRGWAEKNHVKYNGIEGQ